MLAASIGQHSHEVLSSLGNQRFDELIGLLCAEHERQVDALSESLACLEASACSTCKANLLVNGTEGPYHVCDERMSPKPKPTATMTWPKAASCEESIPLPTCQLDGQSSNTILDGKTENNFEATAFGKLLHPEDEHVVYSPTRREGKKQATKRGSYEMLTTWQERRKGRMLTHDVFEMVPSFVRKGSSKKIKSAIDGSPMSKIITTPGSRYRTSWDIAGVIALAYDGLMVPLQIMNLPEHIVYIVIDWLTRIFWTLDMPASLLVGYYSAGELVMDPKLILKKYLTSWFLLDTIIVAGDWALYAVETATEENDAGDARGFVRLLRILRMARMIRLLRLLKLRRLSQDLEDLIDTELVMVYLRIARPSVVILAINHLVACCWYGIGTSDFFQSTWIKKFHIESKDLYERYVTSLHWSLSQFTVGTMDVEPQNPLERSFTLFVMCLGLTVFSSMIGSTTSAIEQLREMRSDEHRNFWKLRKYLKDHEIAKNLSVRICRFAEYTYAHRKKSMQESHVPLIALLSDQLYAELQRELYMHHLVVHAFYSHIARLPFKAIDRICKHSIQMVEQARFDVLFNACDVGKRMVVAVEGDFAYTIDTAWADEEESDEIVRTNSIASSGSGSTNLSIETITLAGGDWAAEASLWCTWSHLGYLQCTSECRIISVDSTRFGETMRLSHRQNWDFCKQYAISFLKRLNEQPLGNLTDLAQFLFKVSVLLEDLRNDYSECFLNPFNKSKSQWSLS